MDIWYQCICGIVSPLFILKHFLQNLTNPLVAKRTIYGRTLGRPVDWCVALGDRIAAALDHYQNGHTTLVKTATLLWSKRPHKLGSYQKRPHCIWSKWPHSFWSKRPQGASPVKGADLATKTASPFVTYCRRCGDVCHSVLPLTFLKYL